MAPATQKSRLQEIRLGVAMNGGLESHENPSRMSSGFLELR